MTLTRLLSPGRTWTWVFVLGAAGSAAYVTLGSAPGTVVAGAAVYLGVRVLGLVGTVLGAMRLPGRDAAPWWCVAAVQLVWVVGDVVFLVTTATGRPSGPPVVLSLGYLCGYAPLVAAVLLLLHRSRAARPPGALLDAAVLAVGLALVGWAALVGPVLDVYRDDPLARLSAGLFLGADVVLTVLVVLLLGSASEATTSTWLALAAVLACLASDSSYLVGGVVPAQLEPLLSLGWAASTVLWAAAALHPSASAPPPPRPAPDAQLSSTARLTAMLAAVLLAPALLALGLVTGAGRSSWPAVIAACAMSTLVVCRLGVSLRAASAALAEREEARRALEHQATHDSLTGLPNRAATVAHVEGLLASAAHDGGVVGLLFLDLDGFKAVNDAHGHRAGDEVLQVVASRVSACLRPGDLVGRLGGDEFVVVLGGLDRRRASGPEETLLAVGQRVVDVVSEPTRAAGHPVGVGVSVGAAASRPGGAAQTAEALLHEADLAAYRAKTAGRGRVELAAPSGAAPVGAVRRPALR